MTIEELRQLAGHWRPKFSSVEAFERSWNRLSDWTQEKQKRLVDMDVDRWMFDDLQRDQERAAGQIREPLVPQPSGAALVHCSHCSHLAFVRIELESSQAGFGDAVRCPACQGGRVVCHCPQCELPTADDHRACVDESGHDAAHPFDCPRCLAGGVKLDAMPTNVLVQRPDGSIDWVATLVVRMKARREGERGSKPLNAYEAARVNGFTGDRDDWATIVDNQL